MELQAGLYKSGILTNLMTGVTVAVTITVGSVINVLAPIEDSRVGEFAFTIFHKRRKRLFMSIA